MLSNLVTFIQGYRKKVYRSLSNCTVQNSFCLWFRNNLAFRLPEFDQDSSDAENMDSESLVSAESLLEDHFVSLDLGGQY